MAACREDVQANRLFRLEHTADRWWFVDPDGVAFISMGVNHADESNLKYPHNWDVWKRKYGSRDNWIKNSVAGEVYDNKLYDIASRYYETITKHIRRYDANHLILGDHYNSNKGIPSPVLRAMQPFVDGAVDPVFLGRQGRGPQGDAALVRPLA